MNAWFIFVIVSSLNFIWNLNQVSSVWEQKRWRCNGVAASQHGKMQLQWTFSLPIQCPQCYHVLQCHNNFAICLWLYLLISIFGCFLGFRFCFPFNGALVSSPSSPFLSTSYFWMAHLFAFYATWHHVSVGALCTQYRYMGPSSQPPNTTWCPHRQDIEYILIYTYQWTVQNNNNSFRFQWSSRTFMIHWTREALDSAWALCTFLIIKQLYHLYQHLLL